MAIEIRDASAMDARPVRAIYSPAIIGSTISFEYEVPSLEVMRARIDRADARHPWLVATCEGAVVGYAYATTWRAREAYGNTVETAVYVHPQHHRRGVARALMIELLDRLHTQGLHMAIAGVALPNAASVALHESLGFTPVGVFPEVGHKLGTWCDVGFWRLALSERRDPTTR